jgi:hypothetical protein
MEKMSTEFDDSPFKNGDLPPQRGKTFAVYSFASAFFSGSGGADPATSVVKNSWGDRGDHAGKLKDLSSCPLVI